MFSIWGSNPRPSAHKTDALPTELIEMMARVGFEPTKHYATDLESAPFDRTRESSLGAIKHTFYLFFTFYVFLLFEITGGRW